MIRGIVDGLLAAPISESRIAREAFVGNRKRALEDPDSQEIADSGDAEMAPATEKHADILPPDPHPHQRPRKPTGLQRAIDAIVVPGVQRPASADEDGAGIHMATLGKMVAKLHINLGHPGNRTLRGRSAWREVVTKRYHWP